jgi:hypothetical protein
MSGYLHRLACSVMQPAEKIHPLVGSVFAGPERSRKQGSLAHNFEVAGTAAAPLPAFSQADQAMLPEIQGLATRDLPEQDAQQGTLDSDSRFTPLLPSDSTTPLRPSPQTLRSSIPASQNSVEPLFPTAQQQMPGGETIPTPESISEDVRENAYTALMPIKTVVAPMKIAADAISSAREFGPNPGRSARQSARNVQDRRAEREPDQIEIHIGRIEVSAVPQSPAAPATKVARKAESLSEYLARRDKRRP